MRPLLHPARTPLARENFRVRWIRPGSQAVELARVAEGEIFREMRLRNLKSTFGALTLVAALASGANLASFSGHILGEVRNSAGVTQMGASVALYNRYDQEIRQVLTNEAGKFVFDTLPPDLYSIRVTLASFMPALRRNISVTAGSENLLKINLASVFSTIELVPAAVTRGALMSDDWKWVLRASQATRPVFRFLPVAATSSSRAQTTLFSNTSALVRGVRGRRRRA